MPGRDMVRDSRNGIPSMTSALRGKHLGIIAEVKRSSPSKGVINQSIDSGAQAASYERGGASAISVLTEPDRFGGRDEDITSARAASRLPILKKDFHVTEDQIVHAALLGASAALVIVRAIEPAMLPRLARAGSEVGIELLYEVRDERELERALAAGATMIGVNHRNLETLQIDPETVTRIVPLIPADCVAIAESGYSSREGIAIAAGAGADAVLVGSALSASSDAAEAVSRLTGIARISRKR
ncbi:MAG TPA: indole-3-glycerol-phosphate synthase [Gemmatimonadaceae bacterium]|nr:indole-3-glycerol-phosphate synthase [Gemmatimonadaceae bacterium]